MTNVSKTGAGLVGVAVFIIIYVAQTFLGLTVLEADAVAVVQGIAGVVGILMTYYGQFKRADLELGLFRK